MPYATEENITQIALDRWATAQPPRLAELMGALVGHIHAFARETRLTTAEWGAAMRFLAETGAITDEKRQEFILASDVLGLSMLVVMMEGGAPSAATPPTVLGPFHIEGSPDLPHGGDAAPGIPGKRLYIDGQVRDAEGRPIAGARLDFWQSDAEGMYEAQLSSEEPRLRAILDADGNGRFGFWTVAPKGYSIPMDGPVGDLIRRTRISPYRPAHVHFIVSADGYRPVTTHLFQRGADYLETDVVFGTRAELITTFRECAAGELPGGAPDDPACFAATYDFTLDRI